MITVTITPEDIKQGNPTDCFNHPIGIAIARATRVNRVRVGDAEILLCHSANKEEEIAAPKNIFDMIKKNHIIPTSFEFDPGASIFSEIEEAPEVSSEIVEEKPIMPTLSTGKRGRPALARAVFIKRYHADGSPGKRGRNEAKPDDYFVVTIEDRVTGTVQEIRCATREQAERYQ